MGVILAFNLILQKSTPATYGLPNSIITYNIFMANTGTIDIFNVDFQDLLDSNQIFVPGSTYINSVPMPALNPVVGFPLSDLFNGSSSTITFNAMVITVPTSSSITNEGILNYEYVPSGSSSAISQTSYTNTVTLPVAISIPVVTKIAPSFVATGVSIPITIVVNNEVPPNNRNLLNVILKDPLNSGLSFIPNSLVINGTPSNLDITNGVSLGNIALGLVVTTSFLAIANSLPLNNPISNTASVNYTYDTNFINPPINTTIPSNTVNIQVNQAVLNNSLKLQSQSFSDINQPITYTISMPNDGNATALNVVLTDTLPTGVTIVPNSVSIDGVLVPGADPTTGMLIGTIPTGTSPIVTFTAIATSIPQPNPYINKAVITFSNIVDPATLPYTSSFTTAGVSQTINSAILSPLVKTTDKPYAKLGDTITYTIFFANTGNATATNVILTDLPPFSTDFIENSLTINGVPQIGANPGSGINFGTVPANAAFTITFQSYVSKLPQTDPITNEANLTYKYSVVPGNTVSKSIASNIVPTTIVYANIFGSNFPKAVNVATAAVGDTITYSVTVKNTGNTDAFNIIMLDTISNGGVFVSDSVSINGVPAPGASPNIGISLDTLPVGSTKIVTFKVLLTTLPSPNPITNSAYIDYDFIVDPTEPAASTSNNTNGVTTNVISAAINSNKAVSPLYADIGDTVTYTIVATASGNTTADTVVFNDSISPYLTFNSGSVEVNSIAMPLYDPAIGFTLPNMIAGQVVTITFTGIVNGIPPTGALLNSAGFSYTYFVTSDRPPVSSLTPSNTVETLIKHASIYGDGFLKNANLYVNPGGNITYSVFMFNSGNTTAINQILIDTLPAYTTFNTGSVIINGSSCPSCNPNNGFSLPPLGPLAGYTVSFSALVDAATPSGTILYNTATLAYSYIVDPSLPPTNESSNSTVASTLVRDPGDISVEKYVDKVKSYLNDILTYSLYFSNGYNTLTSLVFQDTIPTYTVFNNNSLYVNGVQYPGVSPEDSLILTNIPSTSINVINFSVTVETVPSPNPILNSGIFYYTFTDTLGNTLTDTLPTNTVATYVNAPAITIEKSADLVFADLGENINYTIIINNTGNIDFTSLVLSDEITLSSTSFVDNSLYINGVNYPGENPFSSVNLPNLSVNSSITVTFKQLVTNIPIGNVVNNTGTLQYSYTPLPSGNVVNSSLTSNIASTIINHGEVLISKYANKNYSYVGDVLTFTSVITSTGNVSVGNLFFIDTVPDGTTFINGSLVVNGVAFPSYNPNAGFPLGSQLNPGESYTVAFSVDVLTIPNPNPLTNISTVGYNYIVDPSLPIIVGGTANSPPANVNIVLGQLTQLKFTDLDIATIGDTIPYTLLNTNTGSTSLNIVLLNDILPSGVTFVPGSIVIDSVPNPTADPAVGIPLDTIPVGTTVTVTLEGKVISLPTINPATNTSNAQYKYTISPFFPNEGSGYSTSNAVSTIIKAAILNTSKTVDKTIADLNSTLTYNISFANTGNLTATNTIFTDVLQSELSLIPGTLTLNGAPLSGNLSTGINIGTIPVGSSNVISFKVNVVSIPSPNKIFNEGEFSYQYIYNPSLPAIAITTPTNVTTTAINNANFFNITKSTNSLYANIDDIVTYTTSFTNLGNIAAENVVFRDTIPSNTQFLPGSVIINNLPCSSCNISNGVSLNTVAAFATNTISFKVTVLSLPSTNPMANESFITYKYRLSPQFALTTGSNISNTVYTQVNHGDLTIVKSATPAAIDIGDSVTYTVVLTNIGNETSFNCSFIDPIQSGTLFTPNTFYINNVLQPGYDPNIKVTLPDISPNEVVTINFNVTATTIPNPNPFLNRATAVSSYFVDPSLPFVTDTIVSNLTGVKVNHGALVTSKLVNKAYAELNDTLTYTIAITNTGSARLDNMLLIDTLPANTAFVANSLTIDGVVKPGANINSGVALTQLFPPDTHTVTFRVVVSTIPSPNIIYNNATVNSTYEVIHGATPKIVDAVTNEVGTTINTVTITNLAKSLDSTIVTLGHFITYTINFNMLGNTTARNLTLVDAIPDGTVFWSGTSTIDGNVAPIVSPASGINFGDIIPPSSFTIAFKVLVTTIPIPDPVPNTAGVSYSYTVNPNLPEKNVNLNTNTVYTQVNHAALINLQKGVNNAIYALNDTITYTLTIPNVGNIPTTNVIVHDILDNDLIFVPGSIVIDSIPYPSLDISSGIFIGTIPTAETFVVTFDAIVNQLPNPDPIANSFYATYVFSPIPDVYINDFAVSNRIFTQINAAVLVMNKCVDKPLATHCDVLTYSIFIKNIGNVTAENIILNDTLPFGAMPIRNSLSVNCQPLCTMPQTVNLDPIGPNSTTVVTFSVRVPNCINDNSIISNVSSAAFEYLIYPNSEVFYGGANSNYVYTLIQENPFSFKKLSYPNLAFLNEEITYYFEIENTFSNRMQNIIFSDILSNCITFVPNSLRVNNRLILSDKPPVNVSLCSLEPNEIAIISFRVAVSKIPTNNILMNNAFITFYSQIKNTNLTIPLRGESNNVFTIIGDFTLDNPTYYLLSCENKYLVSEVEILGIACSNDLLRQVSCEVKDSMLWSEFTFKTKITLPKTLKNIISIKLQISNISYKMNLNFKYEDYYYCNLSMDATNLLNNILIVGDILVTIDYINSLDTLSIENLLIPFGTYISLPTTFKDVDYTNLKSLIEDAFITLESNTEISLSTSLIIYLSDNNSSCANMNITALCPSISTKEKEESPQYVGITPEYALEKLYNCNHTLSIDSYYGTSLNLKFCPKEILLINSSMSIVATKIINYEEDILDCCCNKTTICTEKLLILIKPTIKIKYIDENDILRLETFNPALVSKVIDLPSKDLTLDKGKVYIKDILINNTCSKEIFISILYLKIF